MTVEAKVLYGLLLDRMSLSIKNNWIDKENRVYIYFKLEEAIKYLNFGKDKCVKLFSELDGENGIGLIKRKKQGLGKPTIIYVMNFSSDTAEVKTSVNPTSRVRHSTEVLTSTKPKSALPENRSQEVGKSDSNNTEINNTDFNDTESILSDHMRDMVDRSLHEATIKKNIEYDSLIKTHKKEDIDGLLNIMLDVVCSKKPYLIISSEKTPTVLVTERMLRVRAKKLV